MSRGTFTRAVEVADFGSCSCEVGKRRRYGNRLEGALTGGSAPDGALWFGLRARYAGTRKEPGLDGAQGSPVNTRRAPRSRRWQETIS